MINDICKRCKNAHFYKKNTTEIVGNTIYNYGKESMKCNAHNITWTMDNYEITYCSGFEKKEEEENV